MRPDKVSEAAARKLLHGFGTGRVETIMDVTAATVRVQLAAHVLAGPASGHRIEHEPGLEVEQQVADEVAAAVARVASLPVRTGVCVVVEAGESRHRTTSDRGTRELGE